MAAIILDTSVLIAVERESTALDELVADDDLPAIAAITVAELGVGVAMARGRHRVRRAEFVEAIVEAVPVIAYDLQVAEAHRDLLVAMRKAGRPRGAHDLIIAATAIASERTVVSADRTGFADLPGVAVRRAV